MSSVKAVLWDMNGVIIDDMRFHLEAFQIYLREFGHDMTEEYFIQKCTGTTPYEVFADVLPKIGNPVSIEEASQRKIDIYFEIIEGKMQILPGARELIIALSEAGYRQAIASGASRREVERILSNFGISGYFGALVACEDVAKGKPNPEPFARAANGVGADPANCVVIEDGEYGLRAAQAAGMRTIAVTNTQSPEQLVSADMIVASLEEVEVEDIDWLLSSALPI